MASGYFLGVYVDRFQAIAGLVGRCDPRALISQLQNLNHTIPERISLPDQFAVRNLFGQALSRIVRAHDVDQNPNIAKHFFAFSSCGLAQREWRREITSLLDYCGTVFEHRYGALATKAVQHVQVARALGVIETSYADPSLNLGRVAADTGLSPSHLSRLLKVYTGRGFVAHLHEHRVAIALRLLADNPEVVVKQVAATVGYRSVTQLDRQCKRLHGVPPTSLRLRAASQRRAARGIAP